MELRNHPVLAEYLIAGLALLTQAMLTAGLVSLIVGFMGHWKAYMCVPFFAAAFVSLIGAVNVFEKVGR